MEMKSEEGTLVSNPAFREPSFKPVVSLSAAPIRCAAAAARYRECLRNHAASAGGNVLDGCGEFMPGGAEGTFGALQCAACACHRNFHRKDQSSEGGAARSADLAAPPLLQLPPPPRQGGGGGHWTSFVTPMKVAFGSGGGSESSSEEMNFHVAAGGGVGSVVPPYAMSKKRHRTKFTQEQKMRMLDYADKVGWRIPREDDVDVQRFCAEVGVKRQVFKVWMHNNKSNTKKQIQQEEP